MTIIVEEKLKSRPSIIGQGAQVELLYSQSKRLAEVQLCLIKAGRGQSAAR